MTVNLELAHTVSPALRDLPPAPLSASGPAREAERARSIPLPAGLKPASAPDTVLQDRGPLLAPTQLAPTEFQSFDGLGAGITGFAVHGAPPDTNGAAGLTQYVQWVNTSIAVYDKATGTIIGSPVLGNSLFAGLAGSGCATNNDGDPVVNYDRLANRWVLSQFSVRTTPFLHCVAVSTTSDARGTYNLYAFQYSAFNDYPKVGVWPDAYYVTFNMFNGNTFLGGDVCAYQRDAMLQGLTATQICFQQGNTIGGLLPSDFDGTIAPSAGSPNTMVFFDTNALDLFKFHVDFTTPANSTFTGPTVIPVAPFSPLCGGGTCVPQTGTANQLDSLADRLMYRLAYRNFGAHESLVVNHSVATANGGGVRWYELQNPNGAVTLAQQSTYAPDNNFRWMGSIAMDKFGDMAMGYSVSSSAMNPSIAVTGRIPTDAANTMEAETTVLAGAGSQTGTLSRWGDYSAMQVDPVDDCTFWYTTQYLKTSGTFNWSTKISSFRFPSCAGGGLHFVPVTPCRVADTRNANGPFGGPFLTGQAPARGFAIPNSACNIPATAQAYSVNMTVVPHGTLGFLTVFPCNATNTPPLASTLNSIDGRVKAAAAIVPAGTGGAICNFATNNTDLVIDINGYFVPATDPTALAFFPVTPCRLVDTRLAAGPLGGPSLAANTSRTLPLRSSPCNLPATAQAYSLNYTVVPKGALGFLTTWPAGQPQPLVSTLNAPTGAVTANAAIVPAAANGDVSVFVTNDSDLVIDVNGYFAAPATGGLSFFSMPPCRVLDTRNALPGPFNGAINIGVAATACGAPTTAQSFVFNATVVPPSALGFLTMWPQGGAQPLVSTLNAIDGAVTSNMAIVPTGNGAVSAFGSGPTQLVLDIFGYFAP
ncbi:MAG: hypothetical protein LAP21_19660 [Acidobacteriia bacterium]|nr:hypothetical protein [Terriglobia bacterium]